MDIFFIQIHSLWVPMGFKLAHPEWSQAQDRNTWGQDASTWRFGQIFPPLWETLWKPKGSRRGPKAFTRGLRRGPSSRTLKTNHFRFPLGEAQMSSRLGESIVFKVSGGSLLGPILQSIWGAFGTPGGHDGRASGLRSCSEGWSNFDPILGSQLVGGPPPS